MPAPACRGSLSRGTIESQRTNRVWCAVILRLYGTACVSRSVQVIPLRSCVRERRTAGPSASSGFPVKLSGVDGPRAAFLTESRIRGR